MKIEQIRESYNHQSTFPIIEHVVGFAHGFYSLYLQLKPVML